MSVHQFCHKKWCCGLVGQSACLVNRRSWVQIPAVPFPQSSVAFVSLLILLIIISASLSCHIVSVHQFCHRKWCCGLVGQSACLVNRRSWVQIPAVPFPQSSVVFVSPSDFVNLISTSLSSHIVLPVTFPVQNRCCGLVGQSACLVNRRSWVQIPAVPFPQSSVVFLSLLILLI